TTPILHPDVTNTIFSTPLPQVLILTAIVVGISTSALGLAIIVRIKEAYGTIEEDEIRDQDSAQ
ncbi:MAG TPA: Na+/H+ antiporter subunit C, partial [Halieaceae bacterium]|nr:Na+/H+ antiporter subunit C [Halieaceae bacterium]